MGAPMFKEEMGQSEGPNGESVESIARLWIVVGELKFELPHPSAKDGREKLAGRVLKHLVKEKEKKAAAAQDS